MDDIEFPSLAEAREILHGVLLNASRRRNDAFHANSCTHHGDGVRGRDDLTGWKQAWLDKRSKRDWEYGWDRARAAAYWDSQAYDTHCFAPSERSDPSTSSPSKIAPDARQVILKRIPGQYYARCPAHDDSDPSLGIKILPDGLVKLNCLAGCEKRDVLQALSLRWSDLRARR